jgi:hypothetical protein
MELTVKIIGVPLPVRVAVAPEWFLGVAEALITPFPLIEENPFMGRKE